MRPQLTGLPEYPSTSRDVIDIRDIVHKYLAETLKLPYGEETPDLGVLLRVSIGTGYVAQWRLVLDDDNLNLEIHTVSRGARSIHLYATAKLGDPTSLDPETILGLKKMADDHRVKP